MVEAIGGKGLEAALARIQRQLTSAASVEVGFLETARYDDGTSVALVALVNEFGHTRIHPNQPARPFFREMIAKESKHWAEDASTALKAHDYSAKAALGEMGMEIKAELRLSINELVSPPLAPSTIAAKGFDKPLIGGGPSGGRMRDSVDFVVKGD